MTKFSPLKQNSTSRAVGWPAASYASILGLEHNTSSKNAPPRAVLAKADIDRATGGMVCLMTEVSYFKGTNIPQDIHVRFSTQEINGRRSIQHVFQIRNTLDKKNKEIRPEKVYFLGEPVYDAEKHGADFNVGELHSVLQAVQELNRLMRPPYNTMQGEYSVTNTLKILKENNLDHIMGQDLEQKFNGISPKGGFNFRFSDSFNIKVANDNGLVLPSRDFARAVIGDVTVNTLDYSTVEQARAPCFATHKQSGILYRADAPIKALKTKLEYSSSLTPIAPAPAGVTPQAVPSFLNLEFQSAHRGGRENEDQKLKSVQIFGSPISAHNTLDHAHALLLANRNNLDMAAGKYPAAMRNLIESDLHERAYDLAPPDKNSVRVDMIRRMGNSEGKPVIAAMGDQLGDSTMFMHRRTDKNGNVYTQGVGIDLGLSFGPKNSEYSGAVPNIKSDLDHFDDLLLTHHHADHSGGVSVYVDAGLLANPDYYQKVHDGGFRGKTLHGTKKQILRLQSELQRNGIDRDKWPAFNELNGNGWIHIRNKQTNELCFSVRYTAGTIPHTASTNGFGLVAYNGNKVQFALLKLGDMRFGKHDEETKARSPIPSADILDREWLSAGLECIAEEQQRMLENGEISIEEMVNKEDLVGRRWMVEIDGTNFKKPGFARTELEAEENEVKIKNGLHEEQMAVVSIMSTTDRGFERELRVALRTNSHFSLVGANLENAGSINNKTGVNLELQDIGDDGAREVQNYLDWAYRAMHNIDEDDPDYDLEHVIDEYKACKNAERREEFIRTLIEQRKDDPDNLRAILFGLLSQNKASNFRYASQQMFEGLSEDIMGEKMKLGSIFVGRDSQTFKSMVANEKGRVRACVTGTQGTENEQEAATFKHFSGRGIFHANPKNRKTAVPLKPGDYFWTIAQGAIPGNESDRHDLEMLGAELGLPLYSAINDGFISYNCPDDDKLKTIIAEQGSFSDYDGNGHLMISNMPIYPSGHGHKDDALAFLDLIKPEMAYLVHSDDPETHLEFFETMREIGIKTPEESIKNSYYYSHIMGNKPGDVHIDTLARTYPSLILLREVRPWNQYYGGYTLTQTATAIDGEGGVVSDALLAGENIDPDSPSIIFSHFSAIDRQEEDRATKKREPYQRRSPAETEGIQEDKLYRGAVTPKATQFNPNAEAFLERLKELGL